MGENKRYYWLKLKKDFFDSKEMKKLRKLAGGDTFTIIYLKMQLLSLADEGKLYFDGVEDSFAEEIALQIDEDPENVKVTILYLQKVGLVEMQADNELFLSEVPYMIGSETDKAEYMRKKRQQKSKYVISNGNNVTQMLPDVTKCYAEKEIEIEKDIEKKIETEIDNKNKNKKTEYDVLIENYSDNIDLRNTIYEFIKMRKGIKKPITSYGLKKMLNKLDSLADNDKNKIAILDQSIMRSWAGIFELNQKGGNNNGGTQQDSKGAYDDLPEIGITL